MRFHVSRDSQDFDMHRPEPPVEGAVLVTHEPESLWTVDVETLEELMEVCRREGPLLITPGSGDEPGWVAVVDRAA